MEIDLFSFSLLNFSGSTIVGVGDSEPPFFLYEEPEYNEVFISSEKIKAFSPYYLCVKSSSFLHKFPTILPFP